MPYLIFDDKGELYDIVPILEKILPVNFTYEFCENIEALEDLYRNSDEEFNVEDEKS